MKPEIIGKASATVISKAGTSWDNLQIFSFTLLFSSLPIRSTACGMQATDFATFYNRCFGEIKINIPN